MYKSCRILFLIGKGSSVPAGLSKAKPVGFAEKIILASLRYFFAKPCTIRHGTAGPVRKKNTGSPEPVDV